MNLFQNVSGFTEESEEEFEEVKKSKIKKLFQESLQIQNIILYVISFLLSTVHFGTVAAPFALSMIAAASSNLLPVGIFYFVTCIGTLLFFGVSELLIYILTTFIFIFFVLIFKPNYIEDRNEKRKLGKYIFLATFLVQAVGFMFGNLLLYDFLNSLMSSIIVYIFYKIFSNAIVFIKEYNHKTAYTIEEMMAASILISIAICAFGDFKIVGFSITNIICILVVLLLGWKNGVLVGAAIGTTIGVIQGMIGFGDIMLVAVYAVSGMISGLLNHFGRLGVAIGFVLRKCCVNLCIKWKCSANYSYQRSLNCVTGIAGSSKRC